MNKMSVRAAVGVTALAMGFACSSSSSGPPATRDAGPEDAPATGDAGPEDAPVAPTVPCDAAIDFPMDGAPGAACGACLEKSCASQLATCQNDCLCVTSIECLAANDNLYVNCNDALSAIGAGNPGLTPLAQCITNHCPVCNGPDAH